VNSIVCLKQVPDTEAQIRVKPDGSDVVLDGVKFIINPYDEFGIEEALRLKEKFGSGKVSLVCLGPARCVEAIRTGLAMGADDAFHLDDPAFEGGDALATAQALAEQIKKMQYDIIFCGKQAIDDDQGQVGVALAEFLNIPHACLVTKVEVAPDKKSCTVNRQIVGGEEVVELPLPCVITTQKGLNEPRYASLPGIMKAKTERSQRTPVCLVARYYESKKETTCFCQGSRFGTFCLWCCSSKDQRRKLFTAACTYCSQAHSG